MWWRQETEKFLHFFFFGKIVMKPEFQKDSSCPRITEQIQILQLRLEYFSRDLKVLLKG